MASLTALFSELGQTPDTEDPNITMNYLREEESLRVERGQVLTDLERQSATVRHQWTLLIANFQLAEELEKLKQLEAKLLPTFGR